MAAGVYWIRLLNLQVMDQRKYVPEIEVTYGVVDADHV